MAEPQPQPFENKILFCDVISYSRLDPVGQNQVLARLNAAVDGTLGELGTPLQEAVIALPTGDGVVLNFMVPDPAVHLTAALRVLERLGEDDGSPFGLRIGLNSDVDSCVIDINGKKNVVGNGINTAQRVMNLGGDAQVLMNGKLRTVFSNYPDHAAKVVEIGDFTVKHGAVLPIAQYLDEARPYLSSHRLEITAQPGPRLTLQDVLRERSGGGLLQLELDVSARHSLSLVEGHVVDFIGRQPDLAHLGVVTGWLVRELLENAYTHGRASGDGTIVLLLDRTSAGLRIGVDQPDVPGFAIERVLAEPEHAGSFLRMMHDAGLRWEVPRRPGRMIVSTELSAQYRLPGTAPAAAPGIDWLEVVADGPRVDETNWEEFAASLSHSVQQAKERGGGLSVNLARLDYLSSRGLRALTLARREAGDMPIRLTHPGERMREILAISRYDKLFTIVD